MRQEHSVVIHRPVSEVFAFVADPANAPRWAEGMERLEVIHETPERVGSTFRLHIREGRRVNVYEGVMVAFEQDRLTRDRITRGSMQSTLEMRYDAVPGGTRVTQVVEFPARGWIVLMVPLIWVMNRVFQRKQLAKLKELLEAGA